MNLYGISSQGITFVLQIEEDWRYVSMVLDRLQLYTFFIVTAIGSYGIVREAPHIFKWEEL